MNGKKSPKIQIKPALPVVCMGVKTGKGRLTKLGQLERFLPIKVQLSTAGYVLGKYLFNFHFSKQAAPEAWGQRFAVKLSTQRGHGTLGWQLEADTCPRGNSWEQNSASSCQSLGVRGPLGFYYTQAVASSIAALSLAEIIHRIQTCASARVWKELSP